MQANADDAPFHSKLSNIESQRIMAVLQEIQKKVYLIGLLQEGTDKKLQPLLSAEGHLLVREYLFADTKYKSALEYKPENLVSLI